MEVNNIIHELEDMVEGAPSYWWFGRKGISEEQFFRLINELKSGLPKSIAEADEITRNRDQVLKEAEAEAARIVEHAREEAMEAMEAAKDEVHRRISREEIVKEAERRAEELLLRARDEANEIRRDADRYAASILDRLEVFVNKIHGSISDGKRALRERESNTFESEPGA